MMYYALPQPVIRLLLCGTVAAGVIIGSGCNPNRNAEPTSTQTAQIVKKMTPDEMVRASTELSGPTPTTAKNGRTLTEQERATLADPSTSMSKKIEIYYRGYTPSPAPTTGGK